MPKPVRAIRYRNLDEAKKALRENDLGVEVLDDGDEEPSGLLSAIPEDRVGEEAFNGLIGHGVGTLVEVEKIAYSGYGPPAEEPDYMGFVSEGTCYVMRGCRLPIQIKNCPAGARDLHHLEALILDGAHPLDREALAAALNLPGDWSFEDLFDLIVAGELTAREVDRLIHEPATT